MRLTTKSAYAGLVIALALSAAASLTSDAQLKTGTQPVNTADFGQAIVSALTTLRERGIVVDSNSAVEILPQAACHRTNGPHHCYLVTVKRKLPPHSMASATVADVRIEPGSLHVSEVSLF